MSSDLDSALRFMAKVDGAVVSNNEDTRQLRQRGFRGPRGIIMGELGFVDPLEYAY